MSPIPFLRTLTQFFNFVSKTEVNILLAPISSILEINTPLREFYKFTSRGIRLMNPQNQVKFLYRYILGERRSISFIKFLRGSINQ